MPESIVNQPVTAPFLRRPASALGGPGCRLGLATRGGTALTADDVHRAIDHGIDFLNWPAREDGLSRAIGELGPKRQDVIVSVQFEARSAADAATELQWMLKTMGTDYIDLLTFYYVESSGEWSEIIAPGGALEYCRAAQRDGLVRRLGLTTHQRPLAAEIARGGLLDALMIRYNAAHRGAEREIFPTTDALGLPVIAYTILRWGALSRPTPDDPPNFDAPPAPLWYRWVLQNPSVTVALMAPHNTAELTENLEILKAPGPLPRATHDSLAAHGRRVHRHAGGFP